MKERERATKKDHYHRQQQHHHHHRRRESGKVYLDEGSIQLVEGATGVTSKLDVDGIGILFGDVCDCSGIVGGGDIECVDDGDDFVDECTCFNKFATSRLFIIFRGNDFARLGAKCSNIASSFIMSIKLAPFMSSFCNWKDDKFQIYVHNVM